MLVYFVTSTCFIVTSAEEVTYTEVQELKSYVNCSFLSFDCYEWLMFDISDGVRMSGSACPGVEVSNKQKADSKKQTNQKPAELLSGILLYLLGLQVWCPKVVNKQVCNNKFV